MHETGKVLKSTGKWYHVLLENGAIISCRIRGKIRLDGLRTTNPVAVGDEVELSTERDDEGNGMIVGVLPRRNYLVRKSTNLSKQMQIMAANVDRAYLMVTLHSPVTHIAFIDRFLVAAESFRIPVSILFNKSDQYDAQGLKEVESLMQLYQTIGYPTHLISTQKAEDIEFLRTEIKGQQVIIGGHSGVGKSSLVNALDPELNTKVGAISDAHHSGQHTTTFAEMFELTSGGFIIDTPGIRAFGLVNLEKEHLAHYFPEMRERMDGCRFNNCKHLNEPNCAVKAAVSEGEIEGSRYDNYFQMMNEDVDDIHRKNIYG